MYAVITGDLIDSTKYTIDDLDLVLDTLNYEFQALSLDYKSAEFKVFRGDSFQGITLEPAGALYLSLAIKSAVNKLQLKSKKHTGLPDLRIAIGVGSVDLKRSSILESNGEAFQFSGKTLDTMKGDYPRLLLKTTNIELNEEFNVHFSLFDSLTSKWSRESAEVVYYVLRGFKEREIAEKLGIYQSAVNQRKKAANWDSIALLLKRFQNVISTLNTHGN